MATLFRPKEASMETLGWFWWVLVHALGLLWALVWFLISGWVSALLQIALVVVVVYFLKYGWQRAPGEILRRSRLFGRFFWGWLRAREAPTAPSVQVREVVRVVRAKEFGDVNLSTLMSLAMLTGLVMLARL